MSSLSIYKFKSYLLAGRLLHFIALVEITMIFILLPLIDKIPASGYDHYWLLKIYLSGYLISLPVFAQLDARSRYQNYKQIKDQFNTYGYDTRILQPVLKSRCQRDAAWVAAKQLGHGKKCMEYFHNNGYRWYHIFPDFVFKKPQFVFTLYFWKTTFFTPTYKPKYDYVVNKDKRIKFEITKLNLDA